MALEPFMSANTNVNAHANPWRPELEGLPQRGDVFDGKYRIEGVLGVGGMGAVFAAMHLRLDERVAIKLLLPESMDNPQLVERFMSEGRMTSKIRSEHVARVMDFGSFLGRPYLVLEYLAGKDLGALIEEVGPLSVPTAVDFLLQASEAIAEAHTHGVIHRDLKPSNLFLIHRSDGSPCVKVLDFGISKILRAPDRLSRSHATPRTLASDVIGSPHYMPPEQLESATNADERSDIWSLGAILHELLAGHPPFQAESITALCATILRDPPASLVDVRADVPPALNAIVRRCLEKDPSNRFANVAELASALAAFGSAAATTSAETIGKILDGGTDPSGVSSMRHLTPKPEFVRQARASALPPTPMRSAVPGYVLGGALLIALCAVGGWELFTQGHRIHDAEARTEDGHAAPAFVIPAVPGAAAVVVPTTPSAPAAQLTTTSANVARTDAREAIAPVAAPAAPAPAAPTVVAVAEAPAPAPPVHVLHHHSARRAGPAAATPSESPLPSDEDNPYGTARLSPAAPPADPAPPTPSVAVSAAPVDTSQLFEERK